MQHATFVLRIHPIHPIHPIHQLRHQTRCIERRCCLEGDADLRSRLVEGGNAVGTCLVAATVPGVLLTVAQEDLVQLFDVILTEGISRQEENTMSISSA